MLVFKSAILHMKIDENWRPQKDSQRIQDLACRPSNALGSQKSSENHQKSEGGVIFQNSGPPEAAPLLDPCLKGAKSSPKLTTNLKEVPFFKNLTRRRQHPC